MYELESTDFHTFLARSLSPPVRRCAGRKCGGMVSIETKLISSPSFFLVCVTWLHENRGDRDQFISKLEEKISMASLFDNTSNMLDLEYLAAWIVTMSEGGAEIYRRDGTRFVASYFPLII